MRGMLKMLLKDLIAKHSKPELAKQVGMVYQVWEDGEITLQKSGDLLWQRSLHCNKPGDPRMSISLDNFPEKNVTNGHAYIFTDRDGADIVRHAIIN